MRRPGNLRLWIAAWVIGSAAPAIAQTVDFEAAAYGADKGFVGVDQWTMMADVTGALADNFKIQSGADGKLAHILTAGTTTVYRPFPTMTGILDARWKWRASGDSAHFCLGVSGANLSARIGNRALACMEPNGGFSAQGSGPAPTASAEAWKKNTWYYMRMVLDNSQGTNKFALFVSEDSLRGAERLALPATTMGGSGAFTRLVLRGEGGSGFVDVDDISWDATAVWSGAADADWHNGKNWDANVVPDSLTHVIFPAGAGPCALTRNVSVKSITVATGFAADLDLGQQVLSVLGRADFSGGMYPYAGAGHIRFPSAHGSSLTGPAPGRSLPPLRHDGAGPLRLDGNALVAAGLEQIQGTFDFNGFDMTITGNLTVKNGQPGTFRNLEGRAINVGGATHLEGASKDTLLGLNTAPKGWILAGSAADSLVARFADLGNARATLGQGYAFQSLDAGGNTGWIFLGPPSVIAQPKDTAVKVGENGWFKVSASSRSTITLQRLRNDKEIQGATDSIYILPGAKKADSGAVFTCRLTNVIGSTVTAPARLRVGFPAPTVTPAPKNIVDSLSVILTASVPGARTFCSRNGAAYAEAAAPLILKDSSLIRAFSVLGPDTSAYALWNFPKAGLPQLAEPGIDPEPYTFDDSVAITMTPPAAGARIFYTRDESVPDSTKLLYQKGFVIKATTTVSAIAYLAGYRPSTVHTHLYIHKETVTLTPPTATPAGGTFTDSIVVRLAPPAAAPQASIYYRLGSQGLIRYTDSLVLHETATLKALAISGSQYSDTAQWEFKRRLEPPQANPKGRIFPDTLRVKLASKIAGASLFYTLDGKDPTPASAAYPSRGILLDSTATLKAVAVNGTDASDVLSETYTLIPDTPSVSPRGGDYSSLITIQLTSKAPNAVIYFTLDGTAPGPERGLPPYSAPFTLDTSATLKAVAVAGHGGGLQRGPTLIENYTFIRPGPRVLGPGQRIDLSSNYSLVSPLPGAVPVDVEIIAYDSLKTLKGFRDILFGFRLSVPDGSSAFPKVVFNAPGGETRLLYALNQNGSARFVSGADTSELTAPGTYFMAVDTLAPTITYSGESFTAEDSTRIVVSIQDNVSNLLLDLDRSDLKSAGFAGREIGNSLLLTVSLKSPPGTLSPLTLRLKVDDHRLQTAFPADGGAYSLKQRITAAARTPAAFHIGSNAADPWDLIALPLPTDPPLTLAQLRKNNSAPDLEGVALNQATGKYRYLGGDEPLAPGAAVWIASAASIPSMVFPALQTSAHGGSASYQLTLHAGWNLVADPALVPFWWPVTRALPDAYDASPLKGLHAWNASLRRYADAESLEPWRGYFAYYKGTRDTVVTLLPQAPTAPAQPTPAAKAGAAPSAPGIRLRLTLAGGLSVRLGASAKGENGLGLEDEPQPLSPRDLGPRLFSARENQHLGTDILRWTSGRSYAWTLVAGLPASAVAGNASAVETSPASIGLESWTLPPGYAAWAVSRRRGMRFPLAAAEPERVPASAPGSGIPFYPGFTDSLDILAGPAAELEARLAAVPRTVGAFSARVSARAGSMALDLDLPKAAHLRLTLWSLDGRAWERDALDLPEGIYHLVRNRAGQGYPTGMYVLGLEWTGSGLPRRQALKIAIP